MALTKRLSDLKLIQLKNTASLLGLPSSGVKAELQDLLSRRTREPPPPGDFARILSIDMGIKNLGICVLEAPHLAECSSLRGNAQQASPPRPALVVRAWKKIDVLRHFAIKERPANTRRYKDNTLTSSDFDPSSLAETAYSLVSALLIDLNPKAILIERQRFRSGGAAGVQEWTIRVNSLESMLWACLETLRCQVNSGAVEGNQLVDTAKAVSGVYQVSPAKVASFWCGESAPDLDSQLAWTRSVLTSGTNGSAKTSKADKIAVAQEWVDQWMSGTRSESVQLDFVDGAAETARAFRSTPGQRRTKKEKNGVEGEVSVTKLDDLADCLLQGVAWIKWEENRRLLTQILRQG